MFPILPRLLSPWLIVPPNYTQTFHDSPWPGLFLWDPYLHLPGLFPIKKTPVQNLHGLFQESVIFW